MRAHSRQGRLWDAAALATALLGAFLFALPAARVALQHGMSWPMGLTHPEGLSLTTNGKWFFTWPGTLLTDAFTGQFPVFYNYVSDLLLNAISQITGWPPMAVQAVIYGPLLVFLLMAGGYFSLRPVLKDEPAALIASVLLGFGANSQLGAWLAPGLNEPLDAKLHVPFQALALATAQSLGWVLFVPVVCALFLARQWGGLRWYILAGASLGLMFHVHTLTFINVAAVHAAYIAADVAFSRPRRRGWGLWLAAQIAVLVGAAVFFLITGDFGLPHMVLAGALSMAANFVYDRNKKFYLVVYPVTAVVAAPYLFHLSRYGPLPDGGGKDGVDLLSLALFFSVYLLAALAMAWKCPDRATRIWLFSMLAITLALGYNDHWGWDNHAYRFQIHLIFPLAIAVGLAIRSGGWPIRVVLGSWLGALVVLNGIHVVQPGELVYLNYWSAGAEEDAFFGRVEAATAKEQPDHAVLINPPEFDYPAASLQSARLLNYSAIPGFIPDYRYQMDDARYRNRMALFCLLFPSYPHHDEHTELSACAKPPAPPASLFSIREPKLKNGILPVYNIRFAAAAGPPFGPVLAADSKAYGWTQVADAPGEYRLVSTEATHLTGAARVTAGNYQQRGLTLTVKAAKAGTYAVALGGRKLTQVAAEPLVNGRTVQDVRREGDWAYLETSLSAGTNRILLPATRTGTQAKDYLYFVAVIQKGRVDEYLTRPGTQALP